MSLKSWKGLPIVLVLFFGIPLIVSAQPGSDIQGGSTVFILKAPKKFFRDGGTAVKKASQQTKPTAAKTSTGAKSSGKKTSGKTPGGGAVVEQIEPIAPQDWINEQADYAIEERKVSDSEPFLSLPVGYLNSRAYFCESPQFPAAARKAKQKLVNSKVLVTVGKYGGILHGTTLEGDPAFRAAVYNTLGSLRFRESYFMGQPIRIEGNLIFTQNPGNTVICRETTQEVEVPAMIDGGVLNAYARNCTVPSFPTMEMTAGLNKVEAKVALVVDEQGNVIEANAMGGGNPVYSLVASSAVRKMTFPKSLIAGKPVKVRGIMEFTQTRNNDGRCSSKAETD